MVNYNNIPKRHHFENPDHYAKAAVAIIRKEVVLADTVFRGFDNDFGNASGDTISVKVPSVLEANTMPLRDPTTMKRSFLNESKITVKITDRAYSTVPLTDDVVTLDLKSFSEQVLKPQSVAISEFVENRVAETLETLPEYNITWDEKDPTNTFAEALKKLRDLTIPLSSLYAVVGTKIGMLLRKSQALKAYLWAGDQQTLRKGIIGQIMGFTVIENTRIDESTGLFYDKNACILASKAPVVPQGASFWNEYAYRFIFCALYA